MLDIRVTVIAAVFITVSAREGKLLIYENSGFYKSGNLRHLINLRPPLALNLVWIRFAVGVGVPVDIGIKGGSLGWLMNIQAIYRLPDNITYFQPYKIVQKRSMKDTLVRNAIYESLEKLAEINGAIGSDCLLRKICQLAQMEIKNSENNLEGDLIKLVLSPLKDDISSPMYKMAQLEGLYESPCREIYSNCSNNDSWFSIN